MYIKIRIWPFVIAPFAVVGRNRYRFFFVGMTQAVKLSGSEELVKFITRL